MPDDRIDDSFGTRDEFHAGDFAAIVPQPGVIHYDGPPTIEMTPEEVARVVGIDVEDAPLFLAIAKGEIDGDVVKTG